MRLPLLTSLEAAGTLARRGVIRPARPDKLLPQLLTLWRWGSTIAAAYIAGAQGSPERAALVDDEGKLTYGDVDRRTNAIARGLSGIGVHEGDRIGVLCRNGRAFVESVVAAAKLGVDILPLNTSFSPTELEAVLERDWPSVLVYDGEFHDLVQQASVGPATKGVLGHLEGDLDNPPPTLELLADSEDQAALSPPGRESRTVILTSGTTGAPKGARLSQPSNLEPLAWFLRRVPLAPRSPYLICAPLFHAHGYGQFVLGAGLGCTVVSSRRFDPERTLDLIDRHRVSAVAVVPTMLKRIMDLPAERRSRYDTSSLQVVLSSGSALSSALAHSVIEELGPVLYNLYGSTEVAWATIAGPEDLLAAPGTVGRPPPHTRLAILGEDGRRLPPGETGHIFVRHELLFEGYTDSDRADLTDGMMTPGDLGHVDAEGRLFVDGRKDDMIVSGGENVYPGEVEEVLAGHPELADVAVIGVDDEQFGQRLVAFAVPRAGSELSGDDVQRYAKERLARYKVPREVELRAELPRNALGKVLKRELRKEVQTWQKEQR
jgi:acyl-CoA synthetase (AMP-forming)/AMP-acid ligase II